MQALVLRESSNAASGGPLYHDLVEESVPIPTPEPGEVLIRILATSLNHRDHWIRKGLYPGIQLGSICGSDACGIVVKAADESGAHLVNQRVIMNAGVGWDANPRGPEKPFSILGLLPNPGTFCEYMALPVKDVFPAPAHLSHAEVASLPVAGLTAYRAIFTKGQISAGDDVLITGIGGGVALVVLRFCLAAGANVYVTSSSQEKIDKAVAIGAKAGVNYRDATWVKDLKALLPSGTLSTVIDSAGGDSIKGYTRILCPGGRIVVYGGTASASFAYDMSAVLKNIDLLGSTMGSRAEFAKMLRFVSDGRIPVDVFATFPGLSSAPRAFEIMQKGGTFGKLVLEISSAPPSPSKM